MIAKLKQVSLKLLSSSSPVNRSRHGRRSSRRTATWR